MKIQIFIIAILLMPVFAGSSRGQNKQDWQPWEIVPGRLAESETAEISNKDNNVSEAAFLGLGLIHFYRKVISPQDGQTCLFDPSCSKYSLMSIKKYGIIKGLLMTGDRLLRCNFTKYGHYTVLNSRFIDPPENNVK